MDYSAYLQNNPGLMQAFMGLRPKDMKYIANQGYDLDGNGRISEPEYGQFHWQEMGINENRSYTPSGPAIRQGGNNSAASGNPYGTAPFTGPGGSGLPVGSNTSLIQPNMAPPANYWDGDRFVIGAPGLQAGSQPAPQSTAQSAPQTPQPTSVSRMPAGFAGPAPGGSPAAAASPMPNASVGGSTQSGAQLSAQIGRQLMPQFDMKGMGSNPFLSGLMNRKQTMRA